MKLYTLLLILLVTGSSFKPEGEVEKGYFSATVDGKAFKVKDDQIFKGILVNKEGSMDGRTAAHTVVSITFNGPSYDKPDHKPFNETVQFEINYEEQKTGPSKFSAALQYQSTDYSMIKEVSKLNITQFTWEPDHKHFRISADFECKMRSWGYPSDGKKDAFLKGKMTNVRIIVPSWISAKN